MWNPLLCSFNLFDSCCNCHLPMLVGYNYGNEDGEGAWLPVWVRLGGEAATITLTIMKLTCVVKILKCMGSHISFCHVMCSAWWSLLVSVNVYAGILTTEHESACCI